MSATEYANLEAFYDDREPEERRFSPEWDYGVHWRDGRMHWPRYRVTWVVVTGEVISVQLGSLDGTRNVQVMGVVPMVGTYPKDSDDWGDFRVQQEIEGVLEGWSELVAPDLDWVRRRLEAHA